MWKRIALLNEKLARRITTYCGSTWAFVIALNTILIWVIGGFFVGFSSEYQMPVNTGTTIVSYLIIFLLQRTQNKDSFALQMKLNELIAAHSGASNRLINVEDLTEEEINKLHKRYEKLATLAREEEIRTHPHTVEEIEDD